MPITQASLEFGARLSTQIISDKAQSFAENNRQLLQQESNFDYFWLKVEDYYLPMVLAFVQECCPQLITSGRLFVEFFDQGIFFVAAANLELNELRALRSGFAELDPQPLDDFDQALLRLLHQANGLAY